MFLADRPHSSGQKKNCVNANNPEKRNNTKSAAKQGNAGEQPDAAARYTVKSSGVVRCFPYFTGIFQRINSGVRVVSPSGGDVSMRRLRLTHEVTEGLTSRPEPRTVSLSCESVLKKIMN